MTLMPWACAASTHFFGLAASMSTSRMTLTFSPIMAWQICSHLLASPSAFWMVSVRPAALNALSSDGRSLFSQRFEVIVSGRITPTLPDAVAPPVAAAVGAELGALVAAAVGAALAAFAEVAGAAAAEVLAGAAAAEVAGAAAADVDDALLPLLLPQPVSATAAMAPTAANFMARLDM